MKSPIANQTLDSCDSTNDLVRALGETGFPHGTWISARIQEKGRGRLGRVWESQEGNLFLSILLRVENKNIWTWIPMTIAAGIAEAVRKKFPRISVEIKWPNDLWIEGKKVGGILCEAVGTRETSFIVAGIGLNCSFAPEGLDQETTSLSLASGLPINADDVRDFIREEVLAALEKLESGGRDWIVGEFSKLAALPLGTEIEWGQGGAGVVIGLGELGELLVQDHSGAQIKLYAEDVSRKVRMKK